jgi:hypothetical protein
MGTAKLVFRQTTSAAWKAYRHASARAESADEEELAWQDFHTSWVEAGQVYRAVVQREVMSASEQ